MRCLKNWQHFNPAYEIHMLNADTLAAYLPNVPAELRTLDIAKQSDWMRLELLHRYGGIWLDASVFLTRSLDWVMNQQQANGADFVGYYLERYAVGPKFPVIDSWFMAAPPKSPFITDWLNIFEQAVIQQGTENYLSTLSQKGTLAAYSQRIGSPAYHTVHVCAQQLIQTTPPNHYALVLLCAEDDAYALHVQSNWKRKRLYSRLLAHSAPRTLPALIKLRGGERRKLEAYLSKGLYRYDSIVGQYLPSRAD